MKTAQNSIFVFIICFPSHISLGQSPGNVSSNLTLWLKADAGTNSIIDNTSISSWDDQSGSINNVTQGTLNKQPTYQANPSAFINYNPTVKFDGLNDVMSDASGILGAAVYSDLNSYIVSRTNIISNSTAIWEACSPNRITAHITWSNSTVYWDGGEGAGNARIFSPWGGIVTQPYLWSMLYSNTSGQTFASTRQVIARNGFNIATDNTASNFTGTNQPFFIGGESALPANPWSADIGETIIYTGAITSIEHNKIESYLAFKYGITLDNSIGGTDGDYTNASGTIVWDASNNPSYHNDIITLGRDDNSELYQKQSHQMDDSTRIYLSTLNTSNTGNTGAFSTDNQFLLVGNNADELKSLGSVEFPSGLGIWSRIEREWKITNTAFNGTFSFDITINSSPVNAADLRILVDTDGNFVNATMYNPSVSVVGTTITISGLSTAEIPLNSTRYFTLVSINPNTPLPVELLNFDANLINNRQIELSWQTASELNNDFFIIERSINGLDWEQISKIDGAGTSSSLLNYSEFDNNPYNGVSYYRLKQTDFDGQFEYSQIRSVNIERSVNSKVLIYPNPTFIELNMVGSAFELEQIRVFNCLGQDVTKIIDFTRISNQNVVFDLSGLSAGVYYVKTKTVTHKFHKQ